MSNFVIKEKEVIFAQKIIIYEKDMNASISMNGLWGAIQSLSVRNKKWLAKKLSDDLRLHEAVESENKVLKGIDRGFKDIAENRVHPIDDLWKQL